MFINMRHTSFILTVNLKILGFETETEFIELSNNCSTFLEYLLFPRDWIRQFDGLKENF